MTCPPTSSIKIATFRPTFEEFKDFNAYIERLETEHKAHKAGICKVIPPPEWVPRRGGYSEVDQLVIPSPIRQRVTTEAAGAYTLWNEVLGPMTVAELRQLAASERHRPPQHRDSEHLERKYWGGVTVGPAVYGADVSGSVTDKEQSCWNIARLGSILDEVQQHSAARIEGVNTPYLYFGLWKSCFPWHTEDMDLYSINYVHFGADKHWYAVPPEFGHKLQRVAASFFSASASECSAFLRHKTSLMSPRLLRNSGIPFDKIVQHSGEFIITFPFGYHSGFNAGWNCAESTNFASRRWLPYGKRATRCECIADAVSIDMAPFVAKYEGPDRLAEWRSGRLPSPHPEEDAPSRRRRRQQQQQQQQQQSNVKRRRMTAAAAAAEAKV